MIQESPPFVIFVIFHKSINPKFYHSSLKNNLIFVNVSPENKFTDLFGFNYINLFDLPNFKSIGKYYTESEVIFNIWMNNYLIDNYDFIGFIHHDMDISNYSYTDFTNFCCSTPLLSFETHYFKNDFSARILLDFKKPNKLYGRGSNCYIEIFKDYNLFHGTNYLPHSFLETEKKIILCSSFIIDKRLFFNLMEFIKVIILSRKLNIFDKNHKYRIQGGIMERYFAVWFLLQQIPFVELKIIHLFSQTRAQNSLFFKIINKIKSYL